MLKLDDSVGRNKKLALTIISLLLWAQLVFSIGLTLWRYWLVSSGEAELFVAASPVSMNALLEETELQCPEDAKLAFLGSESNWYYVQYKLYPRRLTRYRFDSESPRSDEVKRKIDGILRQMGTGACLLVDRYPDSQPLMGQRVDVNSLHAIYIIGR